MKREADGEDYNSNVKRAKEGEGPGTTLRVLVHSKARLTVLLMKNNHLSVSHDLELHNVCDTVLIEFALIL